LTGFFRKRNEGLEDRLRSLRQEPRSDFVRELSGEIRASRVPAAMRTKRFAAALVTTALMVIPFVAFGGVSYASSAAQQAVQSVAHNDSKAKDEKGNSGKDEKGAKDEGNKPDEDQYEHGKKCGHDEEHRGDLKPNQKPCKK
jgi:hypothetical protein